MSIQPTIFGGDTGLTYEDLQRKRALADQLIAGQQRAPRNVGEGLTAIGNALASRGLRKQAEKRDKELRGEFNDQWASLFNGGVPGGMSDVVPQGGMGASSYAPAKPSTSAYPVGDAGPEPRETVSAGGTEYTMGKPMEVIPEEIKNGIFAGESGGDYDALFGFQNRDGGRYGNVKLTDMTVDQALQFADPQGDYGQWVKGQVGRVATPMGAYQIVGTTLRGAKDALGLTGNERMTPDLQDRLGYHIYKTQGTGAWEGYKGPQQGGGGQGGGQMGGSFQPSQGTQTAQAGGMNLQMLAEVAGSPYASPGQKAMAQQLLQQQMQAMDPNSQLDYQLKQAQLANATREPDRKVIQGADGYNYYQDKGERVLPGVEKPAPTPPGSVQEYQFYQQQVTAAGQQPMQYQDWLLSKEKAGANNNTMTTTLGGESTVSADEAELRKKLGGREGEAWAGYMDQADASAGTMQDMELLNELIALAPQGPISGRIAEMFPGANSAADAFNSVVKRVAPTLRVPGSGSQSDIEYEGMLKSLPQLRARPEANAAISAMMQAKAAINMERGEIVRDYQNEDITVQTARERLTELNNRSIMTPELLAIIRQVGPPPQSPTNQSQSSAAPSDRELTEDDLKWLEGN